MAWAEGSRAWRSAFLVGRTEEGGGRPGPDDGNRGEDRGHDTVGNNGSMWSDLKKALPDYHCLAPDLPGHGDSRHIPWRSRAETAGMVATLIAARPACGTLLTGTRSWTGVMGLLFDCAAARREHDGSAGLP